MASMNLDPSSALAEKYKGNRQILEQAVLGRSSEAIDPYSALRALQKLNVADRYEMMQKAMQGQPNPPSIAEQTVAQAAQAQAPAPAPQAPQSGGLAAMPVPEESFNMAGGGLVAFADGGSMTDREAIRKFSYEGLTPEQRQAEMDKYQADIASISKPEEFYGKRAEQIESMREMGPEEMEQQKGLAALQAAAAMAQGSDFARGLGGALGAFGESYGKAVDAANKEKRALMEMQMNMEAAQRQEAVGNYEKARNAADEADKRRKEATMFDLEKRKFLLEDARANRQIDATLAAATAKTKDPSDRIQMYNINLRNELARIMQKGPQPDETDEAFKARAQLEASERAAEQTANQWRDAGVNELNAKVLTGYMQRLNEIDKNIMFARGEAKTKLSEERDTLKAKMEAILAGIPPPDNPQDTGRSAPSAQEPPLPPGTLPFGPR